MRLTINRSTITSRDLKLADEGHEIMINDDDCNAVQVANWVVRDNLNRIADLLIDTGVVVRPTDRGSYNKIEAIKRVRALFGLDLRTAKEFVDLFVPPVT